MFLLGKTQSYGDTGQSLGKRIISDMPLIPQDVRERSGREIRGWELLFLADLLGLPLIYEVQLWTGCCQLRLCMACQPQDLGMTHVLRGNGSALDRGWSEQVFSISSFCGESSYSV